ncbi:unnamed protein product [Adineta steineri]|uniref:Integrase catalytic domain-containing protein n=1 Tax=Adineta steineri TaxID=433720 RepID=A0A814G4X2_9BILA|nr:unnamed protein product [Adineta steineri]CAF3985484.1 unnamed protein product [Adineta steineri]
MDFTDLRTRPDASSNGKIHKWILQLKDHFTKFCWARALQHKKSREAHHCVCQIFLMFGPSRTLQSDNGREFTNELINSLQVDFPNIRIVHGRPRHPQTEGIN